MRIKIIIGMACALMIAVPALAKYRNRTSELVNEIRQFENTPSVAQRLTDTVLSEIAIRNVGLEKARGDFLRVDDENPVQDKWVNFHQAQAAERLQHFENFQDQLEDLIEREGLPTEPPHAALGWLAEVKAQQFTLQNRVKAMPLAKLRDTLAHWTDSYETELNELQGEKRTIESSDDSTDRYAQDHRRAILEACTTLKRQKTEAERDLVNAVGAAINADAGQQDADRFEDRLEDEVDVLVRALETFHDRTTRAVGGLRDTVSRERTVLRMLIARRQSVAEFVEEFNLDKAQVDFALQLDAAEDIAGENAPSGDQRDLEAFVDDARKDLEPALARFETAYEAFVTAFTGTFLPPFNDSSNEPFVEMDQWERWASDLNNCDPVETVASIEQAAERDWGADRQVERVTNAEARAEFRRILRESRSRVSQFVNSSRTRAQEIDRLADLTERRALLAELNR